ncbi:colony stimulating factor 3 (granulocyte) b [Pseudorasbora parva]|uniref:colony stimulating factor 3 (granulocyte) b n=1 Tax=Pseudorasbora parva TaxID=51549 RepID=UPI00351EF1F1
MKFYLILAVHCLTLVCSAPLHELTRASDSAMSLAKKVLSGVPAAHAACVTNTGLTLSGDAKSLEYLLSEIGIPAPPVLKSEGFTLDMSLSRIINGVELHAKLLQDISNALSCPEELEMLIADLRELSTQAQQMRGLAQIATESQDVVPQFSLRMDSDFRKQMAAHLSLQQLRNFTQDVIRSLRHISLSN